MARARLPDGTIVEFDLETNQWVPAAPPAPPAPAKPPQGFLEGVNQEIAGTADIIGGAGSAIANSLLGTDLSTTPYRDLMVEAGIMRDPSAVQPNLASRIGQGIGGASIPVLGLESAIARAAARPADVAARRVPALVANAMRASRGRRLGAEAASAGGAALGGTIGETVGGPLGEAVGTVAGALAPSGGAAATRRAFAGDPAAVASAATDFTRAGVPYTAGQVSSPSGFLGRAVEQTAANLPGGNIVAPAFQDQQYTAFGDRLRELTPMAGDPTSTGARVQRGIRDYASQFNREAESRYGAVYDLAEQRMAELGMEGTKPSVVLDDTIGLLTELTEGADGAPGVQDMLKVFSHPKLRAVKAAFETGIEKADGELDWDGVRKVRSTIGRIIANPGLRTEEPIAELRQVYGALSRDMERAMGHLGDEVLDEWRETNTWFGQGVSHIEDNLNSLVKSNIPERIYNAFESSVSKGSTVAQWYRDALPRSTWREVRDGVLRELGVARGSSQDAVGGRFSPETMLSNWSNKLDDRAKDTLLPRGSQLRRDFDSLARVADGIRRSARTLYNPSGTAGLLMQGAPAWEALRQATYGNVTPALSFVGAALSAAGSMRLLTHPGFVRLMLRSTQWPVGQWVPTFNRELDKLAERTDDDDVKADLASYKAQLGAKPPAVTPGADPLMEGVPLLSR